MVVLVSRVFILVFLEKPRLLSYKYGRPMVSHPTLRLDKLLNANLSIFLLYDLPVDY
jgi:hypothetical protein